MSRRLFAVALLPPRPLATDVDSLRRVVGDDRLADLPPHLTLVPPISLREEAVPALKAVLRAAADRARPFELELGPVETFAPRTPTLHLGVHGDLGALSALRGTLRQPPLDRPDDHPFVGHVTLRRSAEASVVAAALLAMPSPIGSWLVDRLFLLERLSVRDEREAVERAAWVPVAEEPFGPERIVGRGGVEVRLRSIGTWEPDLCELLALDQRPVDGIEGDLLVSLASPTDRPGAIAAAAVGRASTTGAMLERVVVAGEHRRTGLSRHVLAQFCVAARCHGARVVVAEAADGDGVLEAMGFVRAGGHLIRNLVSLPG